MSKYIKQKLTLDRQVTYKIIVQGTLDAGLKDWAGEMTVTVRSDEDSFPVTTLIDTFDQAALQGLLRRLYSYGLPLISIKCIEMVDENQDNRE